MWATTPSAPINCWVTRAWERGSASRCGPMALGRQSWLRHRFCLPRPAGHRPISINLTVFKNISERGHLHWSAWANDPQRPCNGRPALDECLQPQGWGDYRQQRITGFQHDAPAAERPTMRIPRGKKRALPVTIVPTTGTSRSWPASKREPRRHHFWGRGRPPAKSSTA